MRKLLIFEILYLKPLIIEVQIVVSKSKKKTTKKKAKKK